MNGVKSSSIQKLMLLAKFRNIDGFENMSREQLESVPSTSYSAKSTKPKSKKPITPEKPIPAPTRSKYFVTYNQLKVLFVEHNTIKIRLACKLKYDANSANHVTLLMLQTQVVS